MIQEKYSYADTSGQEHHVPIVGFAHPSYDARNACIAAVDVDISAEPTIEDLANRYRDVGAPLLFICCREELQCWDFTTQKANLYKKVSAEKICNFFDQNKEDFSPQKIFLARNLSHVSSKYQLEFVDQGLMSVLEHEMGRQLARLINNVLAVFDEKLGKIQKGVELKRWLFRCAFWLLGAKILQDKSVKDFIKLDLEDISAVLQKVNQHYGGRDGLVVGDKRQQRALEAASKLIKRFASLKNLTIESLAYVYENTLIDKETRNAWGIHATPSYLVDYIVWQLFDWIRDIPQEERTVFEPTCGHAPFLLSASRLLREIYGGDRAKLHKYLKDHLLGIEQDSFAREIARLSLTLADAPNPNGWNLVEGDVYQGEILPKLANKSTVLLCNPPFQKFSPENKAFYEKQGKQLYCFNKAAEVLWRTLPYMPVGSAFGVILPRVFLHNEKLASLRKYIVENFEIREIGLLPENVFDSVRHISCLILGRKVRENDIKTKRNQVRYVRIPKDNLDEFKNTYKAETKIVNQTIGKKAPVYDFRLSILLSDV
ncbi:MAG: N-6 DNA methylase [Planctomycetota bacterium]